METTTNRPGHSSSPMLVLSRKADEEIVIGGVVRVKVLEIRRGRVRIGVDFLMQLEVNE